VISETACSAPEPDPGETPDSRDYPRLWWGNPPVSRDYPSYCGHLIQVLEGSALGTLVELMVEVEILAGSDGRLVPSRMEPDIDHRDLVVADVGGFGALWLQVKGSAHPDHESRVVAFASYRLDAIPESSRLLYLVCLVDLRQHMLGRLWLVPSADFNRLAYRERSADPGRVTLQFSCRTEGDEHWAGFEVPRLELAGRLEPLVHVAGPATLEALSGLRDQVR
jgi:hypothetical protein